jgi:hypothetical protein
MAARYYNVSSERLALRWHRAVGVFDQVAPRVSMDHYHRRLKLEEFELTQPAAGRCAARVVLGWGDGQSFAGTADEQDDSVGQLRCAAEAAALALEGAAGKRISLEVLAVKAIEGFDTIIVVVSLASQVDTLAERLVGSCLIKGQPSRGAVLAVLTATNRLLGRVLSESA